MTYEQITALMEVLERIAVALEGPKSRVRPLPASRDRGDRLPPRFREPIDEAIEEKVRALVKSTSLKSKV